MLIETNEPVRIAELVAEQMGGDVVFDGRRWLYWDAREGVWRSGGDEELTGVVGELLKGARCVQQQMVGERQVRNERVYHPKWHVVGEVVKWLKRPCEKVGFSVPRMRDGSEAKKGLVALRDVLVDVRETAARWSGKGPVPWVIEERNREYVEPVVLGVEWGEVVKGKCGEYERYMRSSLPDMMDRELRERWYGRVLGGDRSLNRLLLEYGYSRCGKGTMPKWMKRLMGKPGYFGTKMEQMAKDFGMDGLEDALLMHIGEIGDVVGRDGHVLDTTTKCVLGEDEMQIRGLWQRQQGMTLRCGMLWQGNKPPRLPDGRGGLTGKMVVIPFRQSFLGKEDVELDEKLWVERGGIVRRLLEASVRWEKAPVAEKWEMSEGGKRAWMEISGAMNPADAFLQAKFVAFDGWVQSEKVRVARQEWEKETGRLLEVERGRRVSEQSLVGWLIEKSSWKLSKQRGGKGGQERGLWGVMPKKREG